MKTVTSSFGAQHTAECSHVDYTDYVFLVLAVAPAWDLTQNNEAQAMQL